MQSQDYLREFATIFFIRKGIILGVTLAALVVGILIMLFMPASYQAKGSIIIKGSNVLQAQDSLGKVNAEVDPFLESDIFSEMQIMQSPGVIANAADKLLADGHLPDTSATPEARAKLIKKIQERFKTELIPRTNVIRTSLAWTDPAQAEIILDTALDMYMLRRREVFNPATSVSFFKTQLDGFHAGLTELEDQAQSLSGGSTATELRDKIRRNNQLHSKLATELHQQEGRLIDKRNYVDFLQKSLKEKNFNFFTSMNNLVLADFAKQIQKLLINLEDKRRIFSDKSLEIKTIQRQLDSLYGLFRQEVVRNVEKERSELISNQEKVASLQAQTKEITAQNRTLHAAITEASRLDREREVMEESYKTFATRYREAKIRSGTKSNHQFNVSILEAPVAAKKPVFPVATSILPTSLIIGLILGVTLGFLVEFFDQRVKRPEDITSGTDLPYLFSIPRYF